MIEENDIPKYKKKSSKKHAKKSDHKHRYEPCVFKYSSLWYLAKPESHIVGDLEVINKTIKSNGTYCPICGKVGDIELWSKEVFTDVPIFQVTTPFEKYIDVEKREND